MLLEMPFVTWSDSVVQEVRDLIEKRHFHIILAHIERFLQIPGNKPYVRQILELPVTVQVNAETLLDFRQKGKMLKMFKKGQAHIIGSDCHGMHHRVPNLWLGREVLEKKLGHEFLGEHGQLRNKAPERTSDTPIISNNNETCTR